MESMTGYTFTPCVGSFTSPGIDTREKEQTAYSVSSSSKVGKKKLPKFPSVPV